MTLNDLMASFGVDADDLVKPYRWKLEERARFFAEAEAEAAIRMRLLYDDYTADLVEIDVTEGVSSYPIDPRFFEITQAWLFRINATRGERLVGTDRDTMDRLNEGWRFDRRTPDRIIVEDTRVVFPCLVNADYTLKLHGYRTPLEPLTITKPDRSPEIAPIHHRFLVYWALHRAYSKPDSETLNPQKAALALAAFTDYFGERPRANQGMRNQADRPHRTRAYW